MKKQLLTLIAILAITLFSCSKQVPIDIGTTEETKKGGKHNPQTEAVLSEVTITNNGNGTFSIDYGVVSPSDFDWMFFRGGNTLSISGNVNPEMAQSFYQNYLTTFSSQVGSYSYYQLVIWTKSGVAIYSNVIP